MKRMIRSSSDIYKDKTCHKGYIINYYIDINRVGKINGKYYYIDGLDYPNAKIISTDKKVYKKDGKAGKGLDNYFYAIPFEYNDCSINTNSLTILVVTLTSCVIS